MTIRVASYNLRGLADDRAAAAEVVRAIDPDVLLLQEIPWYPLSSYRVSAFARACGLLWSGRTWMLSATAVMTSIRIIATDAVDRPLPVAGHPGRRLGSQRGYTTCRVHRPGGEPVSVTSIHLSLDADERVDHTRRLLVDLAEDPQLEPGPHVVGGDLNETVDGAAWGLLGERLRVVTPEQATFPAERPQHWIDAIFASSDLPVAPHQEVGLDGGVLGRATDHLPVWVDLDV